MLRTGIDERVHIGAGRGRAGRVGRGGAGVGRGVGGHPPGQTAAEEHAAQTHAGRE